MRPRSVLHPLTLEFFPEDQIQKMLSMEPEMFVALQIFRPSRLAEFGSTQAGVVDRVKSFGVPYDGN